MLQKLIWSVLLRSIKNPVKHPRWSVCKNSKPLSGINYFRKTLHVRCLIWLWICLLFCIAPHIACRQWYHSHKTRRDSLEGSLDRVLFAAELEFLKILVPRLLQNKSNVNNKCAGKSKQLYFSCDQLFGTLI